MLAALLATIATSHAQDPDPAKFAGVRRQMQSFVDAAEISGSVTVIGRKGGVVSLEAVGLQDLDRGAAMPQDALFRIASMTKPITAIGIMILAEEGKLAIDDPVEKHLPEFRGQMLVAERGPDTVTLKKPSRPGGVTGMLTPGAYGHGGGTGPQGCIDPGQNLFLLMLIQRPDMSPVDESRICQAFPAAAVEAMKK